MMRRMFFKAVGVAVAAVGLGKAAESQDERFGRWCGEIIKKSPSETTGFLVKAEDVRAIIAAEHNAMIETLGDDIAEQAFRRNGTDLESLTINEFRESRGLPPLPLSLGSQQVPDWCNRRKAEEYR